MVIKTIVDRAADLLKSAGVENPRREAMLLLSHSTDADMAAVFAGHLEFLDDEESDRFWKLILRRIKREPFHYITGEREFFGYRFFLNGKCLVPRPETELLIDLCIKFLKNREKTDILDMCTGSGCIAVTLGLKVKNASITAADISVDCIRVAEQNATYHGVKHKIKFVQSDIFDNFTGKDHKFDIILSNPPYVKTGDIQSLMPEVRDYEPHIALDGGEDGLCIYRKIAEGLDKFLKKDGIIALEIGEGMFEDIKKILEKKQISGINGHTDFSGKIRAITGIKKQ